MFWHFLRGQYTQQAGSEKGPEIVRVRFHGAAPSLITTLADWSKLDHFAKQSTVCTSTGNYNNSIVFRGSTTKTRKKSEPSWKKKEEKRKRSYEKKKKKKRRNHGKECAVVMTFILQLLYTIEPNYLCAFSPHCRKILPVSQHLDHFYFKFFLSFFLCIHYKQSNWRLCLLKKPALSINKKKKKPTSTGPNPFFFSLQFIIEGGLHTVKCNRSTVNWTGPLVSESKKKKKNMEN